MQYVQDFLNALDKKQKNKKITYSINRDNLVLCEKACLSRLPEYFQRVFNFYNGLIIDTPRHLEFFTYKEIKIIENRFLHFAIIDKNKKICFDLEKNNNANECNIICYDSKYKITSTFSSFLTNKVWAWIDRGREIWKEEIY